MPYVAITLIVYLCIMCERMCVTITPVTKGDDVMAEKPLTKEECEASPRHVWVDATSYKPAWYRPEEPEKKIERKGYCRALKPWQHKRERPGESD